jgi:hypothetical protein
MDAIKEMQNCRTLVKQLLERHPHLRDNDEKLCANYWYIEANLHFREMSAYDFIQMYAERQITLADSITRMRRKVQEETPELRGQLWEKRHKKEEEVKEYLKDDSDALSQV